MNTEKLTISNSTTNSFDLKVEYPELPEAILKVVEETITNNSKCLDPDKAKGRCLQISHELIFNLAIIGKTPFTECKLIFKPKPHPHFWVYVEGWHIDLTARQFNPFEQCPKIWKHEKSESKGLYNVVRGKGLVLFKLVPFDKKIDFFWYVKSFFYLLKARKFNLVTFV
ncbi:MAG TPA: hypothetical protein VF602_12255 [Pedobacter sp.]|jgi:hypothetical protein